ncbi:AMP-binding protein [Achromobacter sp. AGC39]
MTRPWLAHYPQGVPAEISTEGYSSLADLLDRACKQYATRIACTAMGSDITYAQLDRHARAFAGWLQSLGLEKGARVALMMPNVPAYLVGMLGTLRAGMVVVNVNPLYTSDELERQLHDSGASVILILENFAHTLQGVKNRGRLKQVVVTGPGDLLAGLKAPLVNFVARHIKKIVPAWNIDGAQSLPKVLAAGANLPFTAPALTMDDVAVLQYTGGTTGVPKGAMLSHRNLTANVLQTEAVAQPVVHDLANSQLTIISALPLYHVFAMTVCGLYGLHAGMRNVLIINPRDQPSLIAAWRKVPINLFPGVNTLFNALAHNADFAKLDFSALRLTLGGGMAVQQSVAERWLKITGRPLIEGYGLSETSPVATVNPTNATAYSGSIGLPLPSTDVAILDDAGQEVLLGERGEVGIRGPQVMLGYWQKPEETQQSMTADGFFRTGDIGIMDDKGYTRIVDRKKDMIAVSGFKVYPNEVEAVVAQMPGVLECAAIGVPDERSGESVKVFVVKSDPSLTEAQVQDWCREKLTGYKRPRFVEFRDELPKSNVGKILRRELRPDASAAAATASAATAPVDTKAGAATR